ncbi:hypothetical protein FHX08_005526 [Rhizobium sp. BK529]|uniref:hypothetical protein n=1 Tax=unclassified Rhizobium TaxID=2613769 RepID=UPI00104A8437|nr:MULTISPECIES: hypothetical protein [unclassified Rhizobium]MBB3595116.1 hypothetical protein [Rhizobium sp. BK529]TCR98626.1 hypothetical protein EV281_10816 [Rhizobium sp. BK418]
MSKTDWPKEPITDETMQTLDRILREWCAEAGVSPNSAEAQSKAKTLVDWFEFGVRSEDELARVIRDDIKLADAYETSTGPTGRTT